MMVVKKGDVVWVLSGNQHEEPATVVETACSRPAVDDDDDVKEATEEEEEEEEMMVNDGILVRFHVSNIKKVFAPDKVRPFATLTTPATAATSTTTATAVVPSTAGRRPPPRRRSTRNRSVVTPSPRTTTAAAAATAAEQEQEDDDDDDSPPASVVEEKKSPAKRKKQQAAAVTAAAAKEEEEERDDEDDSASSSSPYFTNKNKHRPVAATAAAARKKSKNEDTMIINTSDDDDDDDDSVLYCLPVGRPLPPAASAAVAARSSGSGSGNEDEEEEEENGEDVEDEEEEEEDLPYIVEYSPTGRATCRRCDQGIGKGEVRISHQPVFRGKPGFRVYRHLQCALFDDTNVQTAIDVGGWRKLKRADFQALQDRVNAARAEMQQEEQELSPDELVPTAFTGETRAAPPGFVGNLLPFQVEGLSWMRHQEVHVPDLRGGILADEMGMGKTNKQ
jgi:Poly(ADP-ribose) polymerase and DNA-Ligase Zn-finger region